MADLTRLSTVAVAAVYDFTPLRVLVDEGGGNGTLMINPEGESGAARIVLDRPAAVERAKKELGDNGLAGRCRAVAQDFFKQVAGGGDGYIVRHVILDCDDESAVKILKNCRWGMALDSKLLIIEGVCPARIDQSVMSRGAAANDVSMLVMAGGRQRSEAEFRSLYEAADLSQRESYRPRPRLV